jgi:autotransporter-associated beta strand protein
LFIKSKFGNHLTNGINLLKAGPGELILTNEASMFGNCHVLGGTLSFTSINDADLASPLGATPVNRPSLVLGDATLRYIGDDPAGHSTNRRVGV